MTQVTPEEISHLANLARLELSDEEMVTLSHDLPKIVEFVEGLRQVKLTDSVAVAPAVPLETLRADEIDSDSLTVEQLSKLAPNWSEENDQLVVPAVFGEGNEA